MTVVNDHAVNHHHQNQRQDCHQSRPQNRYLDSQVGTYHTSNNDTVKTLSNKTRDKIREIKIRNKCMVCRTGSSESFRCIMQERSKRRVSEIYKIDWAWSTKYSVTENGCKTMVMAV